MRRIDMLYGWFVVLWLWLVSCSTPSNVVYFQDAEQVNNMLLQPVQQFRLRPEDKINIVVSSSNPMLEKQFTLMTSGNSRGVLGGSVTPQTSASGGSSGPNQMVAYTVDEQGTITFPILGKLSVAGKTRRELATYIRNRLIERNLVSDPIVTVEYVNLGVNVLGEVNKAGHIDITKDHFTIADAIAYAGDLKIDANRENVMVSREVDGVQQIFYIDLTNMQQMLTSPAYYLQQNDLVYIAPNEKRMRESQSYGNTFNNPSIWISIVTMLVTIGSVIF